MDLVHPCSPGWLHMILVCMHLHTGLVAAQTGVLQSEADMTRAWLCVRANHQDCVFCVDTQAYSAYSAKIEKQRGQMQAPVEATSGVGMVVGG